MLDILMYHCRLKRRVLRESKVNGFDVMFIKIESYVFIKMTGYSMVFHQVVE